MSAPLDRRKPGAPTSTPPERGDILRAVACGEAPRQDATASPVSQLLGAPTSLERESILGVEVAYESVLAWGRTILVAHMPPGGSALGALAAASKADLAIVVIDAQRGFDTRARRCSRLFALMGLRRVLLVVRSGAALPCSRERFVEIEAAFRDFCAQGPRVEVTAIPASVPAAGHGATSSAAWHQGPGLMEVLLSVRPLGEGAPETSAALETADQFDATLVWLADSPLLPGREYCMQMPTGDANATVSPLRGRLDSDTLARRAASRLQKDEIGQCQLEVDRPIAFRPFAADRERGMFLLRDRIANAAVGVGFINFALRRSQNLHWQAVDVTRDARAALKRQKPCVLWFTGLSGAGKSTIANLVEKRLHAMGRHTYLLDGDNVRHGLNKDLGFTAEARVENIRRVAEVARLMADAGLIVLAAFISPFRSERRMARALLPPGEFIEVFVDAPLAVAEARDPKGLYRKARAGQLPNFTGIDSPYEPPERAELVIDAARMRAEAAADLIVNELVRLGH